MLENYYNCKRPEMLAFVHNKHPDKILEIGCGAGLFAQHFPGSTYWGVEPYHDAWKNAKKILDHAILGTYDDACPDIPDKHFDLIVCNDVIEHMIDPRSFLTSIANKITDNGELILSLPNIRNIGTLRDLIMSDSFDYKKAGVLDYTHLHLFTKTSFERMASECGWEVLQSEYINRDKFSAVKRPLVKLASFFIKGIDSCQFAARIKLKRREISTKPLAV